MLILDIESEHVNSVFCLDPRSRLKSPRIIVKVPLSKPATIKFKSSSIAKADTLPELLEIKITNKYVYTQFIKTYKSLNRLNIWKNKQMSCLL